MTKYTVLTDSPLAENLFMKALHILENEDSVSFTKSGKTIQITSHQSIDEMALAGEPMTWDQLDQRIAKSEEDYENGRYRSTDEIRERFKKKHGI
jgi:hypothetical protein